MEKAFFFENEGLRLFCNLHIPDDHKDGLIGKKSYGVVFCPPFGDEHIGSYRVLRNFASDLSKNGVATLRFDYRGYGDSEGEFEEATPDTQVSDIRMAVKVLQDMTGLPEIGLLGLRLGGTSALLASQLDPGIRFVVVWGPVLSPQDYFKKILRQQIFSEMINSGKRGSLEDLTSKLRQGGMIDIGGYYLSGKSYNSICGIDFIELLKKVTQPVHIVLLEHETTASDQTSFNRLQEAADKNKDLIVVPVEPFWDFEMLRNISYPEHLIKETVSWITSMGFGGGIA